MAGYEKKTGTETLDNAAKGKSDKDAGKGGDSAGERTRPDPLSTDS